MLVKVALTPGSGPTVRVVLMVVPPAADDVWRTQTLAFGATVPAVVVNVAVHPIEYSPPVTEIGAAESKPVSVTLAE